VLDVRAPSEEEVRADRIDERAAEAAVTVTP